MTVYPTNINIHLLVVWTVWTHLNPSMSYRGLGFQSRRTTCVKPASLSSVGLQLTGWHNCQMDCEDLSTDYYCRGQRCHWSFKGNSGHSQQNTIKIHSNYLNPPSLWAKYIIRSVVAKSDPRARGLTLRSFSIEFQRQSKFTFVL